MNYFLFSRPARKGGVVDLFDLEMSNTSEIRISKNVSNLEFRYSEKCNYI